MVIGQIFGGGIGPLANEMRSDWGLRAGSPPFPLPKDVILYILLRQYACKTSVRARASVEGGVRSGLGGACLAVTASSLASACVSERPLARTCHGKSYVELDSDPKSDANTSQAKI